MTAETIEKTPRKGVPRPIENGIQINFFSF
jgi:hypothetical protein